MATMDTVFPLISTPPLFQLRNFKMWDLLEGGTERREGLIESNSNYSHEISKLPSLISPNSNK